eukprot:g32976.t1
MLLSSSFSALTIPLCRLSPASQAPAKPTSTETQILNVQSPGSASLLSRSSRSHGHAWITHLVLPDSIQPPGGIRISVGRLILTFRTLVAIEKTKTLYHYQPLTYLRATHTRTGRATAETKRPKSRGFSRESGSG